MKTVCLFLFTFLINFDLEAQNLSEVNGTLKFRTLSIYEQYAENDSSEF